MKKHLLTLIVFLFSLFSFTSVSYAEILKSDDGTAYIVTGDNDTMSYEVISGDLYILKGCTLTTSNQVSIFGNVYVFGSLKNNGTLRISSDLNCLRFVSGSFTASAGASYDYGYVASTGQLNANRLIVKDDFLSISIPSFDGTNVPVQHTHTWQKDYSFKKSCTDTGLVRYRCSECAETQTITVGPEEHVLTEHIDWEPTCVTSGFKTVSCSQCTYYEMVSLPATNIHSYGNWSTVQPTCITDGFHYRRCTKCNYQENISIPSNGIHSYSSWETVTKATAYIVGEETRYCTVCGLDEFRTIAKVSRTISREEKNVKKATASFFKALKKYDIKSLKKCFYSPKKVKLFASKKNVAKYIRKHNKSLWYQIQDIKVTKKTATVTVSCNYYNAYTPIYESFDDCINHFMGKKRVLSSAYDKYQYKRLLYYDKYYTDCSDAKVTLKFKKVGKNWKLLNPSGMLYNVMHCNYTNAYNDYF